MRIESFSLELTDLDKIKNVVFVNICNMENASESSGSLKCELARTGVENWAKRIKSTFLGVDEDI